MRTSRLLLGAVCFAVWLAGVACSSGRDGSNESHPSNHIDRVLAPRFAAEGIIPIEAPVAEVCRRLSADLLGRSLTAEEVEVECNGKSVGEIVDRFQARPEYLLVSRRHWRDRFESSDFVTDWRYLKGLFELVDELHSPRSHRRGGYREFTIKVMGHPGFVNLGMEPEDRARHAFAAFLGRAATDAEAIDLAGLWRPWTPGLDSDPDFPFIPYVPAILDPALCEPASQCMATLFGGAVLDLSDLTGPTRWDSLDESQKDLLREPGRLLTTQPFFWEAAADEILGRLLGWSDGGRFPREPGIILPEVREVVADVLRSTGNYPLAEKIVLTSWLYRMKAEVVPDGFGDDPAAPVPAIYAHGPVKAGTAEMWLDSSKAVLGDLGACDERYPDNYAYSLLSFGGNDPILPPFPSDDVRRLWELQESRLPWDDVAMVPDFSYGVLAAKLGGCPGYERPRLPQTGLSHATQAETVAEERCALATNLGTGSTVAEILEYQTRALYGRPASVADFTDYTTAAAACSGAECTPEGLRKDICIGLLGGPEMVFY